MEEYEKYFKLKKPKICKKTKGEHEFILVIPKILLNYGKYKNMTPEDFHTDYNQNKQWGWDAYHYECVLCGKQKVTFKRLDKY